MDDAARLDEEARLMAAWVVHKDEAADAAYDVLTAVSGRTAEERCRLAASILRNARNAYPADVDTILGL